MTQKGGNQAAELAVLDRILSASGGAVISRSITQTLYVSPNGDNSDGLTWYTAFNELQDALDEASTDANDVTLIQISAKVTFFDINRTGNPTWTGNYVIRGAGRDWVQIRNTHASATSIIKFTGKVEISDLVIFQTGSVNGVIFTNNGSRIIRCGFNSESLTSAATSIYLDGSAGLIQGSRIEDVQMRGHQTYSKLLHLNKARVSEFFNIHMHQMETGIHIEDVLSDHNFFKDVSLGDCTLGIDIDGGNEQHFETIKFHNCTTNVDDEVGDHEWINIIGRLPIMSYPEDVDGIAVSAHDDPDVFGADTELYPAASALKPFRVVGYSFEPVITQKHLFRFSADGGTTFFNMMHSNEVKNQASAAPSETGYIFNVGTRISCSLMAESAGEDIVYVWIKIQEI